MLGFCMAFLLIHKFKQEQTCMLLQENLIVSINNRTLVLAILAPPPGLNSVFSIYCGTASSMPTEILSTRRGKPLRKSSNSLHDTQIVKDPKAQQSTTMKRANFSDKHMHGDNDCWREGVFCSTKTGKPRIFFTSENTGQQVRDEPPTAASEVLYLLDAVREKRLNVCLR